jgi:hypothetical protein
LSSSKKCSLTCSCQLFAEQNACHWNIIFICMIYATNTVGTECVEDVFELQGRIQMFMMAISIFIPSCCGSLSTQIGVAMRLHSAHRRSFEWMKRKNIFFYINAFILLPTHSSQCSEIWFYFFIIECIKDKTIIKRCKLSSNRMRERERERKNNNNNEEIKKR